MFHIMVSSIGCLLSLICGFELNAYRLPVVFSKAASANNLRSPHGCHLVPSPTYVASMDSREVQGVGLITSHRGSDVDASDIVVIVDCGSGTCLLQRQDLS